MKALRLWLVGLSDASRAVVHAAVQRSFPRCDVVEVATVAEAGPPDARVQAELLVLTEPDRGEVAQAIEAVDAGGHPRWAVVVLGLGWDDLVDTVPPEEWNAPLVAKAFRSALLQHELGCENLRLQGDLRTLARRIGHDLYTPMGCISTCAHLLKTAPAAEGPPPNGVILGHIEESLAEMVHLIDRMNLVVRASADPAPPIAIGMAEVIAEVLAQLDRQLKDAGSAVIQPGPWPEVRGVPQWLSVIWSNLLTNALRHGSRGSPIRLEWAAEQDDCRFSVINHGPAIPPAIEAALFRPFDQLHLHPSPGLGLAIVRRLVELQGGRCAYGRRDDGACAFHFTLPRAGTAAVP